MSYQNIIFLMHSTALLRPLAGQGVLVMPQAFPLPPEVILVEEIQLDRRLPQEPLHSEVHPPPRIQVTQVTVTQVTQQVLSLHPLHCQWPNQQPTWGGKSLGLKFNSAIERCL